MKIEPDPEYDFVPEPPKQKRGRQCGVCGMKFDYDVSYGYYCCSSNCPMGFGPAYNNQFTAGMSENGVG